MNWVLRCVAIAATVVLGACASAPAQWNGLGTDPMGMLAVYRVDGRPLTREALEAVRKEVELMMSLYGIQLSSPLEAGFTSGAVDIVGSAADPETVVKPLRPHGVLGFIRGLEAYSYAMVSLIADMARDRLEFLAETNDTFKRLRVAACFVRCDPSKAVTTTAPTQRR